MADFPKLDDAQRRAAKAVDVLHSAISQLTPPRTRRGYSTERSGTMVDPFTAGKGLVVAGKVGKIIHDKLKELDKTERLREAAEIDHRSWRVRRDALVERNIQELAEKVSDAEALALRAVSMVADRQFLKVQANVEYEALREATDERREMLAHAAAGLATQDLTINQKARIERVLRQLDAEDIIVLDAVNRFYDPTFRHDPKDSKTPEEQQKSYQARNRAAFSETAPTSRSALLSTGCVWEDNSRAGGPHMSVLPVGLMVLKVLDSYIKEKLGG